MKSIFSASLALAACVALADTTVVVSEEFTDTPSSGTWTQVSGTAGQTTAANAGTVDVGSAITANANPAAAKTIAKDSEGVYGVAGVATCSTAASTDAEYEQADFVMFVEEAGDEPDYDDAQLASSQIAVAAGPCETEGYSTIYIYCKTNDNECGWIPTTTNVETGKWYRVTLDFDYTTNSRKCQVCLNGIAANSEIGTTTSTNSVTGGSWYDMATIPETTTITNLSFVGSTQIDDVVIKTTSELATYAFVGNITSSDASVPYTYLAKYSLIPSEYDGKSTTVGGSTYTVGQKYVTGLDPQDNSTLKAMALTKTASGGTITIPYKDNNGQTYSIVFTDASGNAIDGVAAQTATIENINATDRTGTLSFNWPTGENLPNVIRFKVKAAK